MALLVREQVAIATSVALLARSPGEDSAAEMTGCRAGKMCSNKLVLIEQVELGSGAALSELAS